MKLRTNPDGSVSPAVPAFVQRAVYAVLRWAWLLIPADDLAEACAQIKPGRKHRLILWVHRNFGLWHIDRKDN